MAEENEDLNLHVKLCSERYDTLQHNFARLDARIDHIDNKVDRLSKEITSARLGFKNLLLTVSGVLLMSMLGLIITIITQIP